MAAGWSSVLDCTGEELRLSVSDDGKGLPLDYETRGHGFRNMRADAGRMGGRLEVESDWERRRDHRDLRCSATGLSEEGSR